MGIQGLLPQLKSMMVTINVEDLKGQTVAVDTYSWLHKGALSCSVQLCKGLPTTRLTDFRPIIILTIPTNGRAPFFSGLNYDSLLCSFYLFIFVCV
jgi:XPG N-terminal domain